jgi:hypothetical protein
MCASFVEALMDHIMEGAMIPKVQIERAVGPILSMFLADVLAETLRDDPALSGPLAMICPEFPLKKADVNQSTNFDWLMYNTERRQLLFVELKTSDTSFKADQSASYLANQEAVQNKGGSFLIDDLKKVVGASQESGKYPAVSMMSETTLPLNLVYNSERERCPCHTKQPFSPVAMASRRPM